MFRGMDKQFFKRYYNSKDFYIAKEGEIIYSTGDESPYLYLVVQGEVRIKVSATRQVVDCYLYDFFGETEILHPSKRNASAVAMIDTILYKISSGLLRELCTHNLKLERNLKNVYVSDSSIKNEIVPDELLLQVPPSEYIPEVDLTLSFEDFSEEVSKELSEAELDKILEKQKSQQEFNKVMKKVGKVEGSELLNHDLLSSFTDSDEWRLVSDQ